MNLKKLTLLATLFLPVYCHAGQKINEKLKREMWRETVRIANKAIPELPIDPKTTVPEIHYIDQYPDHSKCKENGVALERCPHKSDDLGYYDSLDKIIRICSHDLSGLTELEAKAFIVNTGFHEMLHRAFFLKGINSPHHRKMKDFSCLQELIKFTNKKFGLPPKNKAEEKSLNSLDEAIRRDEKNFPVDGYPSQK